MPLSKLFKNVHQSQIGKFKRGDGNQKSNLRTNLGDP